MQLGWPEGVAGEVHRKGSAWLGSSRLLQVFTPFCQYWHCPTLPEEEDEVDEAVLEDEDEDEHTPPTHGIGPGHVVPHPPQFTGSDMRSTQMPLQLVAAFEGHPQTPFWQVRETGQALPQAPQFASSVTR
jgi:hypothetical protein